ncbi:hypothetical protein [Eupransor demetentiae]|uniref:Uncharacterized protein n=1 Tax=Eupransor demetentiae TaxID=3109584 RepID=A0ABP0EPR5_9LACO|nr:hypothetical protein R54876_GBNLAHCA_00305 [Lactobacillaceae bacterium LMG 33000]
MAKINFFQRSKDRIERQERIKQRQRVERDYAKSHPEKVTVIQPETRSERRLTHKGRFELGSDGQLTEKGKTDRLAYRYNVAIVTMIIAIVIIYLFFFFVN